MSFEIIEPNLQYTSGCSVLAPSLRACTTIIPRLGPATIFLKLLVLIMWILACCATLLCIRSLLLPHDSSRHCLTYQTPPDIKTLIQLATSRPSMRLSTLILLLLPLALAAPKPKTPAVTDGCTCQGFTWRQPKPNGNGKGKGNMPEYVSPLSPLHHLACPLSNLFLTTDHPPARLLRRRQQRLVFP